MLRRTGCPIGFAIFLRKSLNSMFSKLNKTRHWRRGGRISHIWLSDPEQDYLPAFRLYRCRNNAIFWRKIIGLQQDCAGETSCLARWSMKLEQRFLAEWTRTCIEHTTSCSRSVHVNILRSIKMCYSEHVRRRNCLTYKEWRDEKRLITMTIDTSI